MIVFAPWRVSSFLLETFGGRMRYAPTRVHFNSQNISVSGYVGAYRIRPPKHVPGQTSPPSAEGLIFFCFFSSIKRRKEDHEARKILHQGKKRRLERRKQPVSHQKISLYPYTVGAYCIRLTYAAEGSGDVSLRNAEWSPIGHLRGVCNTPLPPAG